jgi:hypothetical protein
MKALFEIMMCELQQEELREEQQAILFTTACFLIFERPIAP